MAAHRAPRETWEVPVALNSVEIRLGGGMLGLNRFLMTLQNKRMPVASFALGYDGIGMRATIHLDCPSEVAQRYAALLSVLEDVEGIEAADGMVEVALLKMQRDGWRDEAERLGVGVHRDGDVVVASGRPEDLEAWLSRIEGDLEDLVRLGPVARPGIGGV